MLGITEMKTAHNSRSVVEQITDQILEMVLSSELAPGQPLPINDLAATLGVSHIPVREALRRLERDGLILYQRGKGAQVAPVSAADLHDVYRMRTAIELDVARRSVRQLDDESLGAAGSSLEDMRRALEISRPSMFSPAHRSFHYALLPSASEWDRRLLEQVWTGTERYVQLYLGSVRVTPGAHERIIASHEELLKAAQSRESRTFTKALADHLRWSETETLPGVEHWTATAAEGVDGSRLTAP